MSERLPPQPWMTAPATIAVMDALEAGGGAGCARFVGGAVRNAILGRPVDDVDIAVTLVPDEVTAALKAAGLKAIPTGVEHGTVTAVSRGRPFEITTLRRDVATDGRRAVVAFTKDWAEDARRRDFTLNALYADRHGTLFDPVGAGLADARAGRIAFVGDAETRVREDYLRILRFFRFFAWYGRGEADPTALAACAALKGGMGQLAAERISKEILKLLAARDPRAAVAMMARTGVLAEVLPSAGSLTLFEALVEVQARQGLGGDPLLRLAALLPDDPAEALRTAERLRLSNDQRDRLADAMGRTPPPTPAMSARDIRRAVYTVGSRVLADRAILAWAAAGPDRDAEAWRGLLTLAASWTPPPFPVSGEDVISAGAPKGPRVGQVLREIELWWIDQDFVDDRGAAVEKVKSLVQGSPT